MKCNNLPCSCNPKGTDELFITITAGGKDAYAVLTSLGDIANPHPEEPPPAPKQITVVMVAGAPVSQ